jgi:AmiR/NasT family two-component response regulator
VDLQSPEFGLGTSYRILVAGESCRYRDELAAVLASLGNRVCSRHLRPAGSAEELVRQELDLVVVTACRDRAAALRLIGSVRHRDRLPVVAAIESGDEEWISASVAAGASAAVVGSDPSGMRATLYAACERFAEFQRLEEAFERRAVIERAKGVLMASRGIGGDDAFVMLRDHSRRTNRKLEEIAHALLNSHGLLRRRRRVATRPASPVTTADERRRDAAKPLAGHAGRVSRP